VKQFGIGRRLALPTLLGAAWLTFASADTVAAFDRQAWLQDFAFLKTELERSYANLAWFAAADSGNDLPALERRTRRALQTAESDADAKSAILGFVAGFHDGHLQPLPVLQPAKAAVVVLKPALNTMTARDACAALGYAPQRSVAFSLPFEALQGTSLESDGVTRLFRAGTVTSGSGTRLGIVRIPRFRPQDAPPASCVQAWKELQAANRSVDVDAVRDRVADAWFATLAAQLQSFRKNSVAAVIVDVGGNTGGNDSGDWAARLFTAREVHSARLLIAAAPSAAGYFDEQLDLLKGALQSHPKADADVRASLQEASAEFERLKADVAKRTCDLSWVWRTQRAWDPSGCSRLVAAGFASGARDYLAAAASRDKQVATSLYWPAAVDAWRGAWSGPVYVLIDDKTASSAEMFGAVMQDNHIAKTVGTASEGDGCGFMQEAEPIELPHSHLRLRVPNCVRLRADGSNEVAGIQPDLPVLPTQGEDARARAARLLQLIDDDLHKARH